MNEKSDKFLKLWGKQRQGGAFNYIVLRGLGVGLGIAVVLLIFSLVRHGHPTSAADFLLYMIFTGPLFGLVSWISLEVKYIKLQEKRETEMGEWADFFEDFPDENPANWIEGVHSGPKGPQLRLEHRNKFDALQLQLSRQQARLDATLSKIVAAGIARAKLARVSKN